MKLETLLDCVDSRSVIRYSVSLDATSSDGLVCPPTYAAGKRGDPPYIAFRKAWIDGQSRDVVVLDSPQSQSNRVEWALLQAHRAGRVPYPDIEIRFASSLREPVYSVLQLSHRIYDAVMRACTWNGAPFYKSEIGQQLERSRPSQATALFTHAPITLVLGAWDSNGGGGPNAAKLPRLLTSEIIGLDAQPASLSATKFDPMDIRSNVAELLETADPVERFEIKEPGARGKSTKGKRPSEFGFGSVPSTDVPRAATVSGAIQTSVLSCSGLRHLSFPDDQGQVDTRRDQAGRAVLASLALYGLVAQNEAGYWLRSRCELLPKDSGRLELIGRTLKDVSEAELSVGSAQALLAQAREHAKSFGLKFREEALQLVADSRLQTLVERSREAAAAGQADDDA